MKTTKIIPIFLLLMLAGGQQAFSQMWKSGDPLERELYRLIINKYMLEKYTELSKLGVAEEMGYPGKRDSVKKVYQQRIARIKTQQDRYLPHIDSIIRENDESVKVGTSYVYFNPNHPPPFDTNIYYLSRFEVYRIIRYSLFEKDLDMLPGDPYQLPFIKKRTPKKFEIPDILKN